MDTILQGLASLPDELILIIFGFISKITDKRQFLKTCKKYNIITKQLFKDYEDNFIIKGFNKKKYYCMKKFALELCHDKYFNMITENYIYADNKFLMNALAFFGNTIILDNLVKITELHHQSVCGISSWVEATIKCLCYSLSRYAVMNNQLDVLIWLKNNYNLAENACNMAIVEGNLGILKWLNNNGCFMDNDSRYFAVRYGNLSCLEYVYEHCFSWEWNESMCSHVTESDNREEIIKWAKDNGCPEIYL